MVAPITLTSPRRRLDPALLDARGGFAWWYLDLVGPDGDGVVLIWSFGLPFLPGYASAARHGQAPPAGARPSVNLAVYEGGEETMYLLVEHEPDDARWDGDHFRFGRSTIESVETDGRRRVKASLDLPIPGSADRLTGTITFDGAARRGDAVEALATSEHDWTPLAGPGVARASLSAPGWSFSTEGRGYHDRNGSATPLDALGIRDWTWGRVALPGCELIYYHLETREGPDVAFALVVDEDGTTRSIDRLTVRGSDAAIARYGMPYVRVLELWRDGRPWARIEHRTLVDDGPFYLRFQTVAEVDGVTAHGSGERIRPGRVDRAWMRPFVRMKVHRVGGGGSSVVPFFSGPKPTRLWRYVRQAFPGGRLPEVAGG